MTRISDSERDTLRISAETAKKVLFKLAQERVLLEDRIAKLQAVVDAWDSISGKKPKVGLILDNSIAAAKPKTRAPKGQVSTHVEQILQSGLAYDEPALRKEIEEKLGVVYGRATVYTSLRRGLKEHKFIQEGTKWKLNPLRAASQTT
jgi:hypothetical protein